jgi:predicted Rossmann fold flavoprotein
MKNSDYKAKIFINWLGLESKEKTKELIDHIKKNNTRSNISKTHPKQLTKRFWNQLLTKCNISIQKNWSDLTKIELEKIIINLFNCELTVNGKSRYKEEFVECGGINLKEINFKTMESKICKGLFFSGEIIDVDGITGGFNFQNAWTTGWIAGKNMLK